MSNLRIGVIAVAGLLVMALVARTCGYGEPLVIPDWQDSLRAVRERYAVDSAIMVQKVSLLASRADSAKRDAEAWRRRSLANRPTRPEVYIPTALGDTAERYIYLSAQNDSLWAALDAADSAYADLSTAFDAQKQATAAALAWKDLEAARADSTEAVAGRAIGDLTDRLRRAQRGCRVLGLLPCPVAYAGLGATISGGSVSTGLSVGIGVPIRF